MKSKISSSDKAIAILLVGVFMVIWAMTNKEAISMREAEFESEQSSVRPIDLVNKHLREVYDRQEMERKNVENLNALTAPPIKSAEVTVPVYHFGDIPLEFSLTGEEELIGQDVQALAEKALEQRPLSAQIQKEVAEDVVKATEQKKYRKALAEAIVEKARRQGYELNVDEDYKVRSIKKIVEKKRPTVFETEFAPGSKSSN